MKIVVIALFLLLASCVKDTPAPQEKLNLDPHHITQEQALRTMNTVMGQFYSGTRAVRGYTIETLKGRDLQKASTRFDDDAPIFPEDVLYIVNFDDDEGFAVLAADDHYDPVIAITEMGHLSLSDLRLIEETDSTELTQEEFIGSIIMQAIVSQNNNPFGENTNPFTHSGLVDGDIDTGNPNTGNPNTNGGDTNSGTGTMEKVGPLLKTKWDQCLPYNGMCQKGNSGNGYGGRSATGCVATAVAQIMAYHKQPELIPVCNIDMSSIGLPYPITSYGQVSDEQRDKYSALGNANIFCDTITLSNLEYEKIQQILSNAPDSIIYRDSIAKTIGIQPSYYITKKIEWQDIIDYNFSDYGYFFSDRNIIIGGQFVPNRYDELMRKNIAYLMRWIGYGVHMHYDILGTGAAFAWPTNAEKLLRKKEYTSTDWPGWDNDHAKYVANHLKEDRPVIMSALSGLANGHAWVFDGYYKLSGKYYFHCNFGWGGTADGYYLSGLFNLANRVGSEVEDGDASGETGNYNHMSRLVTAEPKAKTNN